MWKMNRVITGTLWLAWATSSIAGVQGKQMTPHNQSYHRRTNQAEDDPIICLLGNNEVLNQDGSHEEFYSCTLLVNNVLEEGSYRIGLPSDTAVTTVDKGLLSKGQQVYLEIRGAVVTLDEILLSPDTSVQPFYGQLGSRRRRRLNPIASTGVLRPIMIRISTNDSAPTHSSDDLRSYLFDHGELSAKAQFAKCSGNALSLERDPLFDVIDVQLSTTVAGKSGTALANLAEQQVNNDYASQLNGQSIRSYADNLMFIVPPGTGGWAAYAVVSGKASYFNDRWGGYLGALMHELAHNMGLRHAFHNGVKYADRSGYMGSIPQRTLYPERCFNGHNFHTLSWYMDRFLVVEPEIPQLVKMAAFVDYSGAAADEVVVVQVGDLFLHYNRAVDFNKDAGGWRDSLVIVQERSDGTDLLSGLKESESTTLQILGDAVTIAVCSIHSQTDSHVAYLLVSVGYGPTLCPVTPPIAEETTVPTYGPIQPPVPNPSPFPTETPTFRQTLNPTSAPLVPPVSTASLLTGRPSSDYGVPAPLPEPQPSNVDYGEAQNENFKMMTQTPSIYIDSYSSQAKSGAVVYTATPSASPSLIEYEADDIKDVSETSSLTKSPTLKRQHFATGAILGITVSSLLVLICLCCVCLSRCYRIVWVEDLEQDFQYDAKDEERNMVKKKAQNDSPGKTTDNETLSSTEDIVMASVDFNGRPQREKAAEQDWFNIIAYWERLFPRQRTSAKASPLDTDSLHFDQLKNRPNEWFSREEEEESSLEPVAQYVWPRKRSDSIDDSTWSRDPLSNEMSPNVRCSSSSDGGGGTNSICIPIISSFFQS